MSRTRRSFLRAGCVAAVMTAAGPLLRILGRPGAAAAATGPRPSDQSLAAVRWGMVIDTRRLQNPADMERIIAACHRTHNVPDMPGRQEVKWIWTEGYDETFPEQPQPFLPAAVRDRRFLLLCNHCANPPCCRVCPTGATFQRPDGIVVMDMHRCIGCRYCMAACPYGARSFNYADPRPYLREENPQYPTRTPGVVEKCIFCSERLDAGLKPTCVDASDGAILFGDLNDPASEVRIALEGQAAVRRNPGLGTEPCVFYIL